MASTTYPISTAIDCPEKVDYSKASGKSVIVTGGSSGLGAAYVRAFADNRFASPVSEEYWDLRYLAEHSVRYVQCDVRNWQDQLTAFKSAIAHSPQHCIDIVIANAGISGSDEFFEGAYPPISVMEDDINASEDDGDEPRQPRTGILEINLLSLVYTAKLAMHYMKRQGPQFDRCLILKSSIMGFLDTNGSPTYGAAKHGVRGLMKCLRRRSGLRVNVVAPWYIATPLMSDAVMNTLTTQLKEQGSGFALVEDSVKAVMRIATDDSINGELLPCFMDQNESSVCDVGRSIAVLPRETSKSGYLDLDLDDFKTGSLYHDLQTICSNLTHRQLPPQEQK
ncbi:uncharacterized protein Z518_07369 [Rhinocladiella mackenziei CBS 650.93]|uniref:Rhinocladiella mackenziei CBS 650.93 unplaced genomic scaffold supercont1.5, whole genome shotgun sequence n=1 Tax=Rhinocladiella mackenziei CBS 650.93 TaxID=1442369 RepID=A0A0D2IKT5_9EURO|nr:uncharacterized protein Z518_07369 [Rhinocladiella mackenziei CBS 650.93]KIX03816.1 hypothetical protein Z518_07369 [Rhinocladiella mackenziei CBS 650.93]